MAKVGLSQKDRTLVQRMIDATLEYLGFQHLLSLEDGLNIMSVVISIVGIALNVQADEAAAQEIGLMAGEAVKRKLEASGQPVGNVRVTNHTLEPVEGIAPICD